MHLLKPEASSVICPGGYIELALPSDGQPECTSAVESISDNGNFNADWLPPSIIEAVSGKVRIPNNTDEPLSLRRNDHFCQVRLTTGFPIDSHENDIHLPKSHTCRNTL